MPHTSEPAGWLQSISDSPMQRRYALAEPNVDIKSVIEIKV